MIRKVTVHECNSFCNSFINEDTIADNLMYSAFSGLKPSEIDFVVVLSKIVQLMAPNLAQEVDFNIKDLSAL